jgi:hypothetical protein
MAQLVIWSPGCREWLNCQLDEITWLDRQLLSGGKDATLHRPPRCAGFRYVSHGWELFSHDTTYQVYVSPASEAPLSFEAVQAEARHVLPAALTRYEQHAVGLESVLRLETGVWRVSVGKWPLQMYIDVPVPRRQDPTVQASNGALTTQEEKTRVPGAPVRGRGVAPVADVVPGVRTYLERRSEARMAMAYYYQNFIRGAVAAQAVPMVEVVIAMDLTGEGAVSDYKKELQRLIWGEQGHARELAEFLLANGLLTKADLDLAEKVAAANEASGKAEAARERLRYRQRKLSRATVTAGR